MLQSQSRASTGACCCVHPERPAYSRQFLSWLIALVSALTSSSAALAQDEVSNQRAQRITVGRTLEAAPGYPRIHVQLARDGELIVGEPLRFGSLQSLQQLGRAGEFDDLDAMLDEMLGQAPGEADSFPAFLDTGASGYVISRSTAERFDLQREPGAVYHEVGLHGEIPMHVSRPYTLALADSTGLVRDEPGEFRRVERDARLLLKPEPPANPVIELAMGPIDVVGMPAIRRFVVEIDPEPMTGGEALLEALAGAQGAGSLDQLDEGEPLDALDALFDDGQLLDQIDQIGTGPAVTLHPADNQPEGVDVVIEMTYVEFARRRNPSDAGPLPTLEAHPMVTDVTTHHEDHAFTADWLLDTGAPVSIISTAHAAALGLYDEDGRATRPPDFTVPVGGVGGRLSPKPGYRLDELLVSTADGRTIAYADVSVLVTDITTKLDTGETVTLNGVFGTNLLLPTVGGLGGGLPTDMAPGPYRRIWIDGPRGRLLLELR